ncbi:MAG: methylthioribulose 1-phosphate dehydratase [Gammaproteobacteria bacterium]|nr:methylthioribulose 1-phosphate dehydratase [Gammaproteobacteria bacterium]
MHDKRREDMEFRQRAAQLCEAGRDLYACGMLPATSGNLSARLRDGRILITISGSHKGRLDESQLILIDSEGKSADSNRPSSETALHLQIYRHFPAVNAVLHPHSVSATLLSRLNADECVLQDYELLKALPGITTHESRITIPNFPNDQDVDHLAGEIDAWMDKHDPTVGYLISSHGFYTWGNSIKEALRHAEALEFLFKCELQQLKSTSG